GPVSRRAGDNRDLAIAILPENLNRRKPHFGATAKRCLAPSPWGSSSWLPFCPSPFLSARLPSHFVPILGGKRWGRAKISYRRRPAAGEGIPGENGKARNSLSRPCVPRLHRRRALRRLACPGARRAAGKTRVRQPAFRQSELVVDDASRRECPRGGAGLVQRRR